MPARAARSKADVERLAYAFVAEREVWLRRHLDKQSRQRDALAALGPVRDGASFRFRGEAHRVGKLAAEERLP